VQKKLGSPDFGTKKPSIKMQGRSTIFSSLSAIDTAQHMRVSTGHAITARRQGHGSRGLSLGLAGFLAWPQLATKLDQHSTPAVHSPHQNPAPIG
jgi:hypothetical protein